MSPLPAPAPATEAFVPYVGGVATVTGTITGEDAISFLRLDSAGGNPELFLCHPDTTGFTGVFDAYVYEDQVQVTLIAGAANNDLTSGFFTLGLFKASGDPLLVVGATKVGFFGSMATQSTAGATAADAIACLKAFGLMAT